MGIQGELLGIAREVLSTERLQSPNRSRALWANVNPKRFVPGLALEATGDPHRNKRVPIATAISRIDFAVIHPNGIGEELISLDVESVEKGGKEWDDPYAQGILDAFRQYTRWRRDSSGRPAGHTRLPRGVKVVAPDNVSGMVCRFERPEVVVVTAADLLQGDTAGVPPQMRVSNGQ